MNLVRFQVEGEMSKKMNFQTVPLAQLALQGAAPQTDRPRPVVLVVDDETVIADSLAAILRHNGIAAVAAYNGRSALEIARAVPPDLLLSDVAMPGMSGIDLAIAISQAIPSCKVILFSGQAATMDLLSTARDAGHDFTALAKPLHPTELLARISETLASKADKQESIYTPWEPIHESFK
jgi:DNA-binding response OmpR family regulator